MVTALTMPPIDLETWRAFELYRLELHRESYWDMQIGNSWQTWISHRRRRSL